MQRDDSIRLVIGLMALLLPYAGWSIAVILLILSYLERSSRMLSISLAALLILTQVLAIIHINLPIYIIAVSFIASALAPFTFREFNDLVGSMLYIMVTVLLGY
ncbi:MAG: hypothetical protein LUQ22_09235, partial [Methanotrichaceae archaeon]|nr:hypothetical protein [Methanotrichaceae archaeon]